MTLRSPFVRHSELAEIEYAINNEESLAVIIRYDTGLGASSILRELAEQAGKYRAVVSIHGTPSLSTVPYGALSPLIQEVKRGDISDRNNVFRAVLAAIEERDAAQRASGTVISAPPLVILDDAHAVDLSTAELLVTLALSGAVKLVASHLRSMPLPEPMPKLWSLGRAETIELAPLSREEAHTFIQAMLGAPVALSTSWYFWANSGGNPLLSKLLVAEALEDGLLNKNRGVWVSKDGHHHAGRSLQGAVRQQIRGLSAAAETALNLVALAEPVSLSTVEEITGAQAVAELLSRSLIHSLDPDDGLLRLASPIYGDVIRQMVPPAHRRILHDRLLAAVDSEPENVEALLRRVSWAVDSGVEVPEERLLSAALIACKQSQPTIALGLLARIKTNARSVRMLAIKARAHYMLGDYQQAAALLDSGFDQASTLAELLFGALLRATTRMALGMPADSMSADITDLFAAGKRLAALKPEQAAVIDEQVSQRAKLLELMLMSQTGDYANMGPLIDAVLAESKNPDAADPRLNQSVALAMDAERLCASGQTSLSQQRAAEAFAIEHSPEHDLFFLPEMIVFRQLATALCTSDLGFAAQLLDHFFIDTGALILTFGAGASVARGMGFIRQGLLENALDDLLPSVESLRVSDPQQLLGFCTSMAVFAAAKLGRHEVAQRMLADYQEMPSMFLVTAHERAFMSAARAYLKHDGVGVAELLALADESRDHASYLLELNALALALELGELSVLDRLLEVATKVEGPWAEAIRLFASEIRRECADGGADSSAAGSEVDSPRVGEAPWYSATIFDAVPLTPHLVPPAFQRAGVDPGRVQAEPEERVKLTTREREIAILATEGLSDRAIAEKLHLSTRTVEGHLYRCYSKLGVAGRDDLTPNLFL